MRFSHDKFGFYLFGCLMAFTHLSARDLSELEVQELARDLAPKVNIFSEIWKIDPEAELYAGTSRDFIYWILRQFRGINDEGEVEKIKSNLKAMPVIDIREIVGGDSDIDIMTHSRDELSALDPNNFGVRKLDFVSFDRIDLTTEVGQSEKKQGFIPAEKIRLSSAGFVNDDTFGSGLSDLLSNQLSIVFSKPEEFKDTYYARRGSNHPVLLAFRYIRILAQNYLARFGDGEPDETRLFSSVASDTRAKILSLIESALSDPDFEKFLQNHSGRKWLNAAILKSFRSYSNPTAAYRLMEYFGVPRLIARFPTQIQPINEFLFHKKRDWRAIRDFQKSIGIDERNFLVDPVKYFPDLKIYHGAGSREAFRAIRFQGAIPSTDGAVGMGTYGVSIENIKTARDRAQEKSNDPDLVVSLEIDPKARILDLTSNEGKSVFQKWQQSESLKKVEALIDYDRFADDLGIDILIYHYGESKAAVIKNSSVIKSYDGTYIKLRSIGEFIEDMKKLKSKMVPDFFKSLDYSYLSNHEIKAIVSAIPQENEYLFVEEVLAIFQSIRSKFTVIKLIRSIHSESGEIPATISRLGLLRRIVAASDNEKLRKIFDFGVIDIMKVFLKTLDSFSVMSFLKSIVTREREDPFEGGSPGKAFGELLERLVPDLGEWLKDDELRHQFYNDILEPRFFGFGILDRYLSFIPRKKMLTSGFIPDEKDAQLLEDRLRKSGFDWGRLIPSLTIYNDFKDRIRKFIKRRSLLQFFIFVMEIPFYEVDEILAGVVDISASELRDRRKLEDLSILLSVILSQEEEFRDQNLGIFNFPFLKNPEAHLREIGTLIDREKTQIRKVDLHLTYFLLETAAKKPLSSHRLDAFLGDLKKDFVGVSLDRYRTMIEIITRNHLYSEDWVDILVRTVRALPSEQFPFRSVEKIFNDFLKGSDSLRGLASMISVLLERFALSRSDLGTEGFYAAKFDLIEMIFCSVIPRLLKEPEHSLEVQLVVEQILKAYFEAFLYLIKNASWSFMRNWERLIEFKKTWLHLVHDTGANGRLLLQSRLDLERLVSQKQLTEKALMQVVSNLGPALMTDLFGEEVGLNFARGFSSSALPSLSSAPCGPLLKDINSK